MDQSYLDRKESQKIDRPDSLWVIPITMLCIALMPLPYGYYTLLRIVICGASGLIALHEYEKKEELSAWVLGFSFIAILYNPVIPVHLTREIWTPINIITILCLMGHRASKGLKR